MKRVLVRQTWSSRCDIGIRDDAQVRGCGLAPRRVRRFGMVRLAGVGAVVIWPDLGFPDRDVVQCNRCVNNRLSGPVIGDIAAGIVESKVAHKDFRCRDVAGGGDRERRNRGDHGDYRHL